MPRTRSLAWSELKIGIVAVIAIGMAVMFVIAVGGQGGFSWEQDQLITKFPDVKGLKSGAVVRVAGVEVGKVDEVKLTGSEVEVRLKVNEENKPRITDQSRATIGSLSLLGEPVIDILPSTEGRQLQDGDFLPAGRAPGQLADVAEGATQALQQVTGIMQDIRGGKGTVGKLFTDDQIYREVNGLIDSAGVVASELARGKGTIGMMIRDPEAYTRMNSALGYLQGSLKRIERRRGQPWQITEGRRAGEEPDVGVCELRPGQRPADPERQHHGPAAERAGALRQVPFADRQDRRAHREPAERRGQRRAIPER